ncbi:hypothetical protein [Guyparkeria sp.]|uniref:hypothetical protein n=1 Tax=Chromatiales TaxID=135613 RepID=UPI00356A417B
MAEISRDVGILTAIADRMAQFRLPRAKEIKERVDRGEVLTDSDIDFLEKVFRDAGAIAPLLEKNPEYQEIAASAMALYTEITTKALANQEARGR